MKGMSRERQTDREKGEGREEGDRERGPSEKDGSWLVQQYRQLYHRRDDNDSLIVMPSISLVKSLSNASAIQKKSNNIP